jgi:hypothetical protein
LDSRLRRPAERKCVRHTSSASLGWGAEYRSFRESALLGKETAHRVWCRTISWPALPRIADRQVDFGPRLHILMQSVDSRVARCQAFVQHEDLCSTGSSSWRLTGAALFPAVGAAKWRDGVDEPGDESASQGTPASAAIAGAAPCVAVPFLWNLHWGPPRVAARATLFRLGPRSLPTPTGVDGGQRRIRRAPAHGEGLGWSQKKIVLRILHAPAS